MSPADKVGRICGKGDEFLAGSGKEKE